MVGPVPAVVHARFFADSPRYPIRWYAVPPDRPIIPYPSFIANEAMTMDVPPRSDQLWGQTGANVGVVWDPPVKYEAR